MSTHGDDGPSEAGTRRAPASVDTTRPSPARIYDYALGGKDNFAVDRAAYRTLLEAEPQLPSVAAENRAFLRRSVQYLVTEAGIDQFIDVGAGLPTQGNVHEIAQRANAAARVVYVDNDPIVATHGRALLADGGNTVVVQADLREPESLLADPEVTALLNLDRPVAVLLFAVLHFVSDADGPARIIGTFRERMAPGSHLVISVTVADGHDTEAVERVRHTYDASTAPATLRTLAQVRPLFDGFELLDPGLVYVSQWRSDSDDADRGTGWLVGGVARKPG